MSSVKTRKLDISTILSVIKAQNLSGSLDTNASTATITDTSSTPGTFYPTFVSDTSGDLPIRTDNRLTYNPSTNTLSCTTFDGDLSGNVTATSASNVTITDTPSVSGIFYPTFVSDTSGNLPIRTDSNSLTYNPSTNTLSCTTFAGDLSGNATSASNTLTTRDFTDAVRYINFKSDTSGNFPDLVDTDLTYNPFSNNLGIGTNNPAYNLDVSGTANITGNLSVDTNTLFVDTSNNRVGIGETNPSYPLDVNGSANITGNLSVDTNTLFVDATNNRVGVGTSTPETRLDVVGNSIQCSNQGRFKGWYSGGQGSGLATEIGTLSGEGYINTYDRTAGTYGNLNLIAGSTANIRLQTNGNVGIGTNTPSTTLDVSGTGNVTGNFTVDTNTFFVDASNNRVGIGTATPSNSLHVRGITRITNDDGASMFYVNWGSSTGNTPTIMNALIGSGGGYGELQSRGSIQTFYTTTNERMRIESTGNVGINSTTPGQKLSIEGSGTANEDVLRVNNQGNFASRIWLRNSGRSSYFSMGGTATADNIATGTLAGSLSMGQTAAGAVQFFNGSTASVKMTILDNGNVGIGTNAPAYPLDVSGSAKFTTIRDIGNNVGSSGQVLSSTGSALSWIAPPSFGAAVIRELTLSTSNSPITFTLGGPKSTRQLTNIQFNSLGITLSGTPNNTFTIPTAGTYIFRARASYAFTRNLVPAVAGSQLFLHYQNASPSPLPDFIIGEASKSFFSDSTINSDNKMNYVADMVGIGTVGNNAVMSLEQQVNNLSGVLSANGGQFVNVAGQNSIYATIEIQRIA